MKSLNILNFSMKKQTIFIGIVGLSGAGKSSICAALKKDSAVYLEIKNDTDYQAALEEVKKLLI